MIFFLLEPVVEPWPCLLEPPDVIDTRFPFNRTGVVLKKFIFWLKRKIDVKLPTFFP